MSDREAYDPLAGDLLRLAVAKSRLSQEQLADRAGVAQSLISAYENGRRQPTLPTLTRLIAAAGLELRTRLAPPGIQPDGDGDSEATAPESERQRWADEQRRRRHWANERRRRTTR